MNRVVVNAVCYSENDPDVGDRQEHHCDGYGDEPDIVQE